MSQENVEIVKVAYEALAREGLDRFIEHFTDDVEYRVHGADAPDGDRSLHAAGFEASRRTARSQR